ncbi:protocadherin gamma-A11-like isoform X7 [Engraulis encrasicolus]|uniref:protocadherin gamma-A11-like isoform X7 n=1 Tax=Engraulis encrasicolus TaxID=184585 RepID=UPI002FD350D4
MSTRTMKPSVLLFVLMHCLGFVHGQVSYSIPEEMATGSLVGNIAQDLGLDIKRLKAGKARVFTGDQAEYITLDTSRGVLLIKERIDREGLCRQTTPCALHFQIILQTPMELYSVTVEIMDINDNPPTFVKKDMKFEISEYAAVGARFMLDVAADPDVGINGLQSYSLNPTDNFQLNLKRQREGAKMVEMVLQKPLDREKQRDMVLVLTASDGGEPQMTGTLQIHVTVLDANDNAPVFTQQVYRVSSSENSQKGTRLTTVSATDADDGSNSIVTYSLSGSSAGIFDLFEIDSHSGDIILTGGLDYELARNHEFYVEGKDEGGLSDSCKIIIDVVDVNDNSPVISTISQSSTIAEDAPSNTVIAMISVNDPDSDSNGQVSCSINENIPFAIKSTSNRFYSIVTDSELDRETNTEYNITVTCSDEGVPSLSSRADLSLKITDVNDNAPVFEKSSYEASVLENNSPGLSIFTVKARDADWNQNARVSYILEDSSNNGVPMSSYVSVNAESGVVHAVRSFDYEQIKTFTFHVKAQDGGSPPLSSNVSVKIIIQDQNDNAPQVLYPVQTSNSVVAEIVPRSADIGYLVTKVVAVDVDSGQNAWLSYKLQKATDRALFEVGAQNGEIRTIRQVTDKDSVKQKLTVVVEDNGQPSRSATVNVNVALADSFPEVLSEFSDFTHDKEYNDNLTFYLVLALAVVSFLFIVSIIAILSVKCYRWKREKMFYKSNGHLPVIPYYPPLYADAGGTGTLQHMHNFEVYRTTDSRKSCLKYGGPGSESIVSLDNTGTLQAAHREKLINEDFDDEQKPPNADWRFNQNQRPGPSGAAATPDGMAVGTGPWPQPPTEAEQLQALMAAANEKREVNPMQIYLGKVSEATNTLQPGTMGLSTRYSPQFTLQHVPDYRQNVYIPGSTATLTSNPQQQMLQQQAMQQQMAAQMGMGPAPPQQQQALPPAQAGGAMGGPAMDPEAGAGGAEAPKAAQTPASKKKSTKKEKK